MVSFSETEYRNLMARASLRRQREPSPNDATREVGKGGLQEQIEQYLKSLGAQCWYDLKRSDKPTTSRAGVPDFVGVYRGHPFAIECKTRTGKVTPEQMGELHWLEVAGAKTCLARHLTDAVTFLESLLK